MLRDCFAGTDANRTRFQFLQILLGVQREFDHSFDELVGRDTGEVADDEFLGEEAAHVAQFADMVAGGKNKVAVSVVDHNHDLFASDRRPE